MRGIRYPHSHPSGLPFLERHVLGRRPRAALAAIALLALLPGGCKRSETPVTISLPPTSVLSTRSSWAVVTENLLRVREKPSQDANVVLHIRRGNIVEIVSRTEQKEDVEGGQGFWYLVDYSGLKGWVFGAYLQIVASKAEAQKLATALP
jgi:hypothetical protein